MKIFYIYKDYLDIFQNAEVIFLFLSPLPDVF